MHRAAFCLLFSAATISLSASAPFQLAADTGLVGIGKNKTTPVPASAQPFEPIQPIPLTVDIDEYKAELGKQLFNDRRLEKHGRLSCADCHDVTHGGANTKRVTEALHNTENQPNTPTIFNVTFNKNYYWSARFTSLDQQLDESIKELGVTWEQVIDELQRTPAYVTWFNNVFPHSGITISNVKQAIIAYERSLITPNSRFDKYLRGDVQVLSHAEKRGYELFKSYGCSACHQGINVGGNVAIDPSELYGKKPIFSPSNIPTDHNRVSLVSRGNTKLRVPSLRNVAVTAPYFHDGSADTLEQAVTRMMAIVANTQLGIRIPPNDIQLIVAFLRTLTGEYNGKAL
jgi:cytochrome c peroxidase